MTIKEEFDLITNGDVSVHFISNQILFPYVAHSRGPI